MARPLDNWPDTKTGPLPSPLPCVVQDVAKKRLRILQAAPHPHTGGGHSFGLVRTGIPT